MIFDLINEHNTIDYRAKKKKEEVKEAGSVSKERTVSLEEAEALGFIGLRDCPKGIEVSPPICDFFVSQTGKVL